MKQQPNTMVTRGDVESCIILVGGEHPPLVLKLVAAMTTSCQPVQENRGFFTYRCHTKQDVPFTLAITGVGPSATEIAFVEYRNCGARLFIRAGTSGALSPDVARGSVVITTRALRYDGVSDLYFTRRFGAIADRGVVRALERSAHKLNIDYHSGVTLSTSAFYAMDGEERSAGMDFVPRGLQMLAELRAKTPVLNIEMESATLLLLSRRYGLKSGSVCGISNQVPWQEGEQVKNTELALRNALRVAVEALDYLA